MSFADVAADAWYHDVVSWASANGIAQGYGGGLFGPEDTITREQLVVMLHNYAKWKGLDVDKTTELTSYSDQSEISPWADGAFGWAVSEGLVTGRTLTTLVPKGTATRAEAATLLQRFIENIT